MSCSYADNAHGSGTSRAAWCVLEDPMASRPRQLSSGLGRHPVSLPWRLACSVFALLTAWSVAALSAPVISIQVLPAEPRQIMDGFGTCLYGSQADSGWFRSLFLDDLRSSI